MALSIKDFLMGIENTQDNKGSKIDPRTVWEGIANRKTWEELGFESESELRGFLVENPYENL